MSVREKNIGFYKGVMNFLGTKYVNIFLDEVHNRLMLKRAEPNFPNVISIRKDSHNYVINDRALVAKLREMFGEGARVNGHEAGEGIIIFEETR